MRLIDADELKKEVLKWLLSDPCGIEEKEFPFETDIVVSLMMEIEEAPTIEPKRGEWIQTSNDWIAGTCGAMFYPYHCSSCGYETYDDYDGLYNFCPNCGCRMKGANDE